MASSDTIVQSNFGGQWPVRTCTLTLTVAAGQTTASATSTGKYRGTIEKVEIDPGTLAANATIKGYEYGTLLDATTRDQFLNYTVPNPAVERVLYPMVGATSNTGGALTTATSTKYVIDGQIQIDLATATAANSVVVTVFVRG